MDKVQKGYLILLFLLSPFIGLFNLFKLKNERDITFFGTLFFGLIGSLYVYVEGSDGYSHLTKAKAHYLDMSLSEFFAKTYEILTFSSIEGFSDLYMHCLAFISIFLFRSPELIHVFAGFVLGYFFTKSVLLVLKDNLRTKKGYILLGFITLFLLIRSVGALNSIRMWTGMWVLFYGSYGWAITKEKKFLYVVLVSVMIHFSYAVILIPVTASYVLQKRKEILVAFYVVSFFTTVGFSLFESYIPDYDLLENKQKVYAIDSDEKADRFAENKLIAKEKSKNANFYKASGEINYLNYSIVGLSVILIFFYFKKVSDRNLNFLIAVGLGLYSFSNVVAFSPSLQGRTKTIAATFFLAAAIHIQLTLKNYGISRTMKRWLNVGFVCFLISAIPMYLFQLSYIMQSFSPFGLLFPQASWVLGADDYSIRQAIGILID